ncbi:hypothetical protein [Streptomyces sp. NPDC040750]|uniref:hypothetical protein n=1 Tax=Streptomyces sp. NPDC040750 TaxID=3154491 RepID=UPI0033EE3F6C
MLSHVFERGVLVVTVHEDPGISGRALLLTRISELVEAHRQAHVVVVLDEPAAVATTVSVVLRVHHLCRDLGVLLHVATGSAAARRVLEANADTHGDPLGVHADVDTAVASASAFTAAA